MLEVGAQERRPALADGMARWAPFRYSAHMDRSFQVVAEALAAAGIPFLVGGGFAVNAHGFARTTADIDLLIGENDLPAARHALEGAGYRSEGTTELVSRFTPPPGLCFAVDLLPLEAPTFAALCAAAVARPFAGREVRVPALDHLLAMKIHAMKHDRMLRGLKDLQDIAHLARAHGRTAEDAGLRDLCLRFGSQEIWESVKKVLSA